MTVRAKGTSRGAAWDTATVHALGRGIWSGRWGRGRVTQCRARFGRERTLDEPEQSLAKSTSAVAFPKASGAETTVWPLIQEIDN